MTPNLTIDLVDLLDASGGDYDSLHYILLVELKSSGFPIDFDYKNPKNPKPRILCGNIKTIPYGDNVRVNYIYHE